MSLNVAKSISKAEKGGLYLMARNRKISRQHRREERLEARNAFGISDPTPRKAVDKMIREEKN